MNEKRRISGYLNCIYQILHRSFGYQNWWPIVKGGRSIYIDEFRRRERTPDEVFEIAVGALLTQNTNWKNAEKALIQLKRSRCLSIKCISDLLVKELAQMIKPAGYFNQKAKKLKALVEFIQKDLGGSLFSLKQLPLEEARAKLLSVWGIGRETADSILLYGLGFPIFVVDAYTRRIFSRLGMIDMQWDYDKIREFFESSLTPDKEIYQEFHALIVVQGKNVCKNKPLCEQCVLMQYCPAYGKQ